MPKITRVSGNVKAFGSAQESGERTLFGQTTVSNDLSAQFTPEFLRGWGIVGASDFPKLQDFNAATFTNGQLLAYLHQMGVAEYDAGQEFYLNSVTQFNGALYISIQNGNTGRQPNTNPDWWKPIQLQFVPVEQGGGPGQGATKLNIGWNGVQLLLAVAGASKDSIVLGAELAAFLPKRAFSANDFIRFPDVPGGLIIQWGTVTYPDIAPDAELPVTFPVPFPSFIRGVIGTAQTVQASVNVTTRNPTKTGVAIVVREGDTGTYPGSVFWVAIGN